MIHWLPASPKEGWASMDRYWHELHKLVISQPPSDFGITCALTGPPPVRSASAPRWQRFLEKYILYPRRARLQKGSLYHILDHSYAHLLKHLRAGPPKVVTVFDLVPLEDNQGLNSAQVERFRRTVMHLRNADHLISISEETKHALQRLLGIPPERVTVAVPGTDFETFQKRLSESHPLNRRLRDLPPIIFSVGSTVRRKNLASLPAILAAMRDLFQQNKACFVRAGDTLPEALRQEITAITGPNGFIELGPLFGSDLIAAFQSAKALIFPSTLEGLTFVIPEAMAAGCPVVTNTLTANPEAGGEAALYYSEGDSAQAAHHLRNLITQTEFHAKQQALGLDRARLLTWHRHWQIVQTVYQKLLYS